MKATAFLGVFDVLRRRINLLTNLHLKGLDRIATEPQLRIIGKSSSSGTLLQKGLGSLFCRRHSRLRQHERNRQISARDEGGPLRR